MDGLELCVHDRSEVREERFAELLEMHRSLIPVAGAQVEVIGPSEVAPAFTFPVLLHDASAIAPLIVISFIVLPRLGRTGCRLVLQISNVVLRDPSCCDRKHAAERR